MQVQPVIPVEAITEEAGAEHVLNNWVQKVVAVADVFLQCIESSNVAPNTFLHWRFANLA